VEDIARIDEASKIGGRVVAVYFFEREICWQKRSPLHFNEAD
jgi:hypothetical protein